MHFDPRIINPRPLAEQLNDTSPHHHVRRSHASILPLFAQADTNINNLRTHQCFESIYLSLHNTYHHSLNTIPKGDHLTLWCIHKSTRTSYLDVSSNTSPTQLSSLIAQANRSYCYASIYLPDSFRPTAHRTPTVDIGDRSLAAPADSTSGPIWRYSHRAHRSALNPHFLLFIDHNSHYATWHASLLMRIRTHLRHNFPYSALFSTGLLFTHQACAAITLIRNEIIILPATL